MYDSTQEPCCMAYVTSGGRDEHEPGCPEALPRRAARPVGPCPCECNRGGFCGGCGHAGCGGRR